MNQMSPLKSISTLVVLLVIVFGAVYVLTHQPVKQVTTASQTPSMITFYCSNDATIDATFATSSVALTLSDGRALTLPQTMSASGARYEASTTDTDLVFWNEGNDAFITENGNTTYDNCTAAQVASSTVAGENTYTDQSNTFTFTVPTAFSIAGSEPGYSEDWSEEATTSGMVLAHIDVPKSYEAGTNFGDARFTVGVSSDPSAVADCLVNPSPNVSASSTQVTINGVSFTKFAFGDAGAGNRYDTTSYRTVRDGECYAVEYTVHYSVFENYPPGTVKEFDETKVATALDQVAQSFHFLP